MTTIEDLPYELVGEITALADNCRASEVSREWYRVVTLYSPRRSMIEARRWFLRAKRNLDHTHDGGSKALDNARNAYRWRAYQLLREYRARFRMIVPPNIDVIFNKCILGRPRFNRWFRHYANDNHAPNAPRIICGRPHLRDCTVSVISVLCGNHIQGVIHFGRESDIIINFSCENNCVNTKLVGVVARLYRSLVVTFDGAII